MTDNLAPCPFCGGELYSCDYDGGKTRYAHAATGCILDRKFVQGEKQKADWNRRTPPPSAHVAPDEDVVETVAGRIYEDAHKGMANIWAWNDRGLDDEHPGTRERYLGYARSAIAATAPPAPSQHVLPIELDGVSRALENKVGFWKSCSGCHELNEGVPTGPYSRVLKCHLGMGCSECGGIGAIWDTTDYEEMGRYLAGDAETRIAFGLQAQGHIPAVEAALAEGADWQEIGRRIGWDGETAKTYYERHLARLATTEGKEG